MPLTSTPRPGRKRSFGSPGVGVIPQELSPSRAVPSRATTSHGGRRIASPSASSEEVGGQQAGTSGGRQQAGSSGGRQQAGSSGGRQQAGSSGGRQQGSGSRDGGRQQAGSSGGRQQAGRSGGRQQGSGSSGDEGSSREEPSGSGRTNAASSGKRNTSRKQPRTKIRHRQGALALKEIIKYQRTTTLLLRKLPFARVVREIILRMNERNVMANKSVERVTSEALECLQEASEYALITFLSEAYQLTLHRKRVTLSIQDIRLMRRLRSPLFDSV